VPVQVVGSRLTGYMTYQNNTNNNLFAVMCQVFQSGNPRADEIVLSNMAVVLDRVFFDVEVMFNYLYSIIMSL
jgi:hypothetical protein